MRIFINLVDDSGQPRNLRMNVANCNNTTQLLNQICKEIGIRKNYTIVSLKSDCKNLRIIEGWPLETYKIRNGSNFVLTFIEKYKYQELSESTQPLLQIREEMDETLSESSKTGHQSAISSKSELEDQFLQDCLKRMLEAIREGNLERTACILNEEIQVEDQGERNQIFSKKHSYLLNQLGEEGKNALHEAIYANNIDIVNFLMIKGAEPTILTIDDYTPLQLAIVNQSSEIACTLLEQKLTDINQNTSHGTALHLAVSLSDTKAVQLLLKNEADLQITNSVGKKPLEICTNQKIADLLRKKLSVAKVVVPPITKGDVFKVSSFTKRLKPRLMTLNPFKQQLVIETTQKEVQNRIELRIIEGVEQIEQKSWLMNNNFYYFTLSLASTEESSITIALKNQKTYSKWIKNFKHTFKYIQNSLFNKSVPANEHVVQVVSDQKNEIIMHKRKVEQPKSKKMTMSIMNLRLSRNALSPNNFIDTVSPERVQNNYSVSIGSPSVGSQSVLGQSTIILGSILKEEGSILKEEGSILKEEGSILKEEESVGGKPFRFENEIAEVYEQTFLQPQNGLKTSEQTPINSNFRKNSEKIDYISEFKKDQKPSITFKDFELVKMLGNGSFGQVYEAKYLKNNRTYALKVLNKKKLIAKKQLKYAVSQANILKKVSSPFIIKMYFAFQTPMNLYMAIDNCSKGDLSEILIVKGKLNEKTARFVIAQLILAIQYLHENRILYRDMKPENILIANDGYIRLTDFGLSKENNFSMSFCGSPAYLSPEMLQKKGVGFQSDIYGIGTVLFEMVVGDPPYFDEDMKVMFENIRVGKLKYPSYLSIEVKSLVSKLLERDVNKRLGCKDINQIKKHDFFKNFDWRALQMKELPVPSQLLIGEQEKMEDPVALQAAEKLMIDDTEYEENKNGMMSRIKNYTFVRDQPDSKFSSITVRGKQIFN